MHTKASNQMQDILPSVTHSEAIQQTGRLTYTKKELVALLSLSPVTLWRSERRGLIHSIAGIRHKLYSVAEVKRFSDGRAQT